MFGQLLPCLDSRLGSLGFSLAVPVVLKDGPGGRQAQEFVDVRVPDTLPIVRLRDCIRIFSPCRSGSQLLESSRYGFSQDQRDMYSCPGDNLWWRNEGSMADVSRLLATAGVRDGVTDAVGVWLVLGVFLDGWAHFNRQRPETFFTPWHLTLYSGFVVLAFWTATVIYSNHSPGISLRASIPDGYRGTLIGIVIFGVGGLLDLLWHEAFGVEVAVDALVSPTHLVLGAGGVLILSTGARSARAVCDQSPRATAPLLVSVVLTAALVSFFLVYASAFVDSAATVAFVPTPEGTPGHAEAELPVIAGLAGYVVTTVLIAVPLLYVLGSGASHPLPGTVTGIVGVVAWLPVGVIGFPPAVVGGAVGATAAGVAADLVLLRLSATSVGVWLPAVVGGIVALVWAGQLAGLALTVGVRWPVSLWLGAVALSACIAAGLGVLAPREADRRGAVEAAG